MNIFDELAKARATENLLENQAASFRAHPCTRVIYEPPNEQHASHVVVLDVGDREPMSGQGDGFGHALIEALEFAMNADYLELKLGQERRSG